MLHPIVLQLKYCLFFRIVHGVVSVKLLSMPVRMLERGVARARTWSEVLFINK